LSLPSPARPETRRPLAEGCPAAARPRRSAAGQLVQLFLVIAGQGWVAGPDGERMPISAGWGVRWDAGEIHTSGTEAGLTALAVEGRPLDLFEPE
jgi:hypothetical protein